ncbi:lysine N(6)-hydroxylase/L-ornithine N(5)-oxygenase family protein [Priestia koreensis]|uniref:lysine N(6)-hydroxylase/L-ornithine N(5)-oxygenase family protein n=1 Tax=Priestia koreensis TaxID=284581 RepID=UPI001F5A9C58|nr:lysine N(6)-hydroxylase/L-ornithine N(5)-oxygenase family protein [Priestia koreensis]MCM3004298.1 lysine N(6)-hydroxylase/L-ornithine N(5)-oxygenase family protein [Priestia koreensis]UNL83508.1 lysine N(6)-hydroxylase/L-ornithine N(5)-oxygenase family protein [Priestia koreensis]
MEQHECLDVIGIGIGPFNLGMAALLEKTDVQALFFERKEQFDWHPGMMLDGTTLQVPFMADLVTMVDPKSPYSFLNYLHEHNRLYSFYFLESFHIPRAEYNHYCQWVSKQLRNLVFQTEVEQIDKIDNEKRSYYAVKVKEKQQRRTYYAKQLIVGTGTKPYVPEAVRSCLDDKVYHSSRYKMMREETKKARSITVIGSGQSAAEIFYDLLDDQENHSYELSWYTRSTGFYPMEYSKLGLEHFSPDYTRYFYQLPEQQKAKTLKNQALLYKGISFDTIAAIYDKLYERTIGGATAPVHMQALTEVQEIERTREGVAITLHQQEQGHTVTAESDVVIFATGYHPYVPACLDGLLLDLEWTAGGQLAITEDYRIKGSGDHAIFVQNGELHTHGVGAPDLGLGAFRNAVIINQLAGKDVYRVDHQTVFQKFGTNLPVLCK